MAYEESRHSDPTKKAKRVRSWYLYEQYKTLESNQLQAAKALKNRSSQDRILHQELRERRARRRLCDQFDCCQSESRLPKAVGSDTKTLASASTDDFIDSLSDIHPSNVTMVNSDHTYNLTFNPRDKCEDNETNYAGDDDSRDEMNDVSVHSESLGSELEVAQELEREATVETLETLLQETVNVGTYGFDHTLDYNSRCKACRMSEHDSSLPAIWSRLVTFAYQVLRLHRGNCYGDYSAQIMTAVLACDILCKGLNKMCDILQPFVTPIKFEIDKVESNKKGNRQTNTDYAQTVQSKSIYRCPKNKPKSTRRRSIKSNKRRRRYVRSVLKRNASNYNSYNYEDNYNIPREQFCEECFNHSFDCIENPMIKLCRYMDSIVKDLDD